MTLSCLMHVGHLWEAVGGPALHHNGWVLRPGVWVGLGKGVLHYYGWLQAAPTHQVRQTWVLLSYSSSSSHSPTGWRWSRRAWGGLGRLRWSLSSALPHIYNVWVPCLMPTT